jgi:hypothetical protein
MPAMTASFPIPVSLFSRDTVRTCSAALEQAWEHLACDPEPMILSSDAVRNILATGIVIAVTLGVRDKTRLARAALQHFEQHMARLLPPLEPVEQDGVHPPRSAGHYRFRAEELRTAIEEIQTPACRGVLTAIVVDYERLARSAERIEISRKALNGSQSQQR